MSKLLQCLKWLAIVIGGGVGILLLVAAILNWRAGARLQERLSAVREAGDPLTLAELAPAAVAPGRNAATFLRRAEKDLAAMQREFEPLFDKSSEQYYKDGELTDAGAKLIRETFAAYPDALATVRQAIACPEYATLADFTQAPSALLAGAIERVSTPRLAARTLQRQVDLLLFDNDREEALRTSVDILRLARHVDKEPMMVGYLVAIAVRSAGLQCAHRVLRPGHVSGEGRRLLDDELARHEKMDGLVPALESERVFGIAQFHTTIPRAARSMWWFRNDECEYLDLMKTSLAIGPSPPYQVRRQWNDLRTRMASAGPLTRNVMPAVLATCDAAHRTRALVRCLRVANAIQKHAEVTGNEPASLDELDLPTETTHDPYTGRSLQIKKSPDGWIVYSVGRDETDDGGKIERFKDLGVGPFAVPHGPVSDNGGFQTEQGMKADALERIRRSQQRR